MKDRPSMKLILISSSNSDAIYLSQFFVNAHTLTIPTSVSQMQISMVWPDINQTSTSYLDEAIITVLRIHSLEAAGDILLFLSDYKEIESFCDQIHHKLTLSSNFPKLVLIPIYFHRSQGHMQAISAERSVLARNRKLIITTDLNRLIKLNSSHPGSYKYVIDSGFMKQRAFNLKTGISSIVHLPVSIKQAQKRTMQTSSGGQCHRLYTASSASSALLASTDREGNGKFGLFSCKQII